ncbi:hypothetical protein ONS95_013173 [Cadophora gregata]|uniref:uncharacterized protein n=1 Tax=Cadophora gregata TaxID=51156 RepID=UPI0026DCDE8F|nr:uncharacterized protein ONS95_013173 [Cadophora gregata]KAK0100010.1 hypothetical protein ONS96_007952 [Cadophora gregata f. sp. sojae]KAK0116142.1 hypothetical protein ONS95_013173 [Cadophora gregata]
MDQHNNYTDMDKATIQNSKDQSLWSRDKADQKKDLFNAALQAVHRYVGEGYSREEAERLCCLKEIECQYNASKRWINHVVLVHTLPIAPEHDPEAWMRKTRFEADIPTIYDFCDIVAEVLIGDRKASEFDACMISNKRIEAIKEYLINGTPIFVEDGSLSRKKASSKQASLKHDTPGLWDYTPLSQDPTAVQFSKTSNDMVQQHGYLYRKVKEGSRDWNAMANLYSDRPGLKLQAPITPIEMIRPLWIEAHIEEVTDSKGNRQSVHLGRDATYRRLQQGLSSEITKEVIALIADRCPVCIPKRIKAKEAAMAGEPLKKEKRDLKRGSPRQEEEGSVNRHRAKRRKENATKVLESGEQAKQQPGSHSIATFNVQNQVGQSNQDPLANNYYQIQNGQDLTDWLAQDLPQFVDEAENLDPDLQHFGAGYFGIEGFAASYVPQFDQDMDNTSEEEHLRNSLSDFLADTNVEAMPERRVVQPVENNGNVEQAFNHHISEFNGTSTPVSNEDTAEQFDAVWEPPSERDQEAGLRGLGLLQ